MSVRANFWEYFHTRVRTNRLDGQIVSGERIVWCANGTNQFFDEQIVWYLAVWKDDFSKTICPSRRTSRWPCCQTICPSRLFVRPGNAHFSSFDFTSNKLKLIFASHSDSSWSEKSLNCPPYFFVTSIQFERKPVWPVLWSSNTVWYLYSFWALFVLYEVQFNG